MGNYYKGEITLAKSISFRLASQGEEIGSVDQQVKEKKLQQSDWRVKERKLASSLPTVSFEARNFDFEPYTHEKSNVDWH